MFVIGQLRIHVDSKITHRVTWGQLLAKSNVIWVTRRRTLFIFQYKLQGKVLEAVDTTKYLGIYLSHD